jgi:hypothetical protein
MRWDGQVAIVGYIVGFNALIPVAMKIAVYWVVKQPSSEKPDISEKHIEE